ncbi:unnamed protein product, partial [Meganyctiphanes norvegica]
MHLLVYPQRLSHMHISKLFHVNREHSLNVGSQLLVIETKPNLGVRLFSGATKKRKNTVKFSKNISLAHMDKFFLIYFVNTKSVQHESPHLSGEYYIRTCYIRRNGWSVSRSMDLARNETVNQDTFMIIVFRTTQRPPSISLLPNFLPKIWLLSSGMNVLTPAATFTTSMAIFAADFFRQVHKFAYLSTGVRDFSYLRKFWWPQSRTSKLAKFRNTGTETWKFVNLPENISLTGLSTEEKFRPENRMLGPICWGEHQEGENANKKVIIHQLRTMSSDLFPIASVSDSSLLLLGSTFTVSLTDVRRSVRPRVLEMGSSVKKVYDIITCLTTRVMVGYLTLPFVLLRFWPSIEVYKAQYFYLHILGILAIYVLPIVMPPPKRGSKLDSSKLGSNAPTSIPESSDTATSIEDASSKLHKKLEK